MNGSHFSLIDIVLLVLLLITIVVPLALFVATFWSVKAAVIMYTNPTYLVIQIAGWIVVDIILIGSYFVAPEWYHNNILLLAVGIPAPVIYRDLMRSNAPASKTASSLPNREDHGAYDGDFIPGHERHEI
jgi:hypothetical protein